MFRRNRPAPSPSEPIAAEPSAAASNDDASHDERLASAARAGDLNAFNGLVTRHERAIYGLCLRMLRDPMAAEDVTQETFLKAWSSLSSFKGGLFRAWLFRIATNRCHDVIRARGRRPASSLDAEAFEIEPEWSSQATPAEDPETFALRVELSRHLERALAALPDDQRLAIILSDIHGHPYDEIARITGANVGTVKSRISRGRAKLRDELRADPARRELLDRFGRFYEE